MCKVKTGRAVRNFQDVQNLVTGIIFRQVSPFQRDELVRAVIGYMAESPIKNNRRKIEAVIDATLMTYISDDWLVCQRGWFIPQRVTPFLSRVG